MMSEIQTIDMLAGTPAEFMEISRNDGYLVIYK